MHISGEEIADKLGVSRNSVWKAIKQLTQEGYNIEAVRNKGYSLIVDGDIVSKTGIESYLENKDFFNIEVHNIVSSTNAVAKRYASDNVEEGKVIVALEQSEGRGRFGRAFYSPAETGIYFSLILNPKVENNDIIFLTSLAAVAVCEAIEKLTGEKASIKWVNDIFVSEKKVCGILTEASFSVENNAVEYLVLGIGINIYTPKNGFPSEINKLAGSITSSPQKDVRNKLLAESLNEILKLYTNFDTNLIAKLYKQRSFLIGKEVYVIKKEGEKLAIVIDITDRNELLVKYQDEKTEKLSSGEISLKLN